MPKIMLVNVTHVEESRVATLDDGVLDAYEIETINRTQIKGNIYNAIVENVHPSLEAAFVKLTPELNGFLPLDEVNFNLLPSRGEGRKSGKIGQHLHAGQRIMAQVVREPFAGKPPTVSTYFSLPGRYLVLMPGVDSSGVSRKIEDSDQRDKLKGLVDELSLPDGFGLIVRTAGMGRTKAQLQRDLRYLLRLWQSVQRGSQTGEFPAPVYREADLVIRTIRDHLTTDIGEVWIDSKPTYEAALAFVRSVMPARAKTLRLYTGDRPLFNKYNLEEQIESIYKRRVPLPSGGEIVIDGTEALTAIDVNSARSKRRGDAEETIRQTNVEAAAEISRQLRLRDLGGLIVVDFIDMSATRNKKKVEDALRAAMKGDRARHDMTRISKLGLVEIARQRLRTAKMAATYNACPTCEGYGLIKNLESAALAALRKLQTRSTRGDVGRIRVTLPVDVATWMLNHKREELVQTERSQNIRIDIEPSPRLLRHETEFESFPREATEPTAPAARLRVEVTDRVPPLPPSDLEIADAPVAAPEPPETAGPAEPADVETPGAESPPPRRRRRRRRRGSGASSANGAAESEAATDPAEVPESAPPAPATESETPPEDGEAPGRKRRRRRRRPRPEAGSEATTGDDGPPRGVRSDELMPAAVAGRRRRRGPRS